MASVTVVYFDLTMEKMEAKRAELIAITLNVAKIMILYSVASTKSEASVDERLEHEFETNRSNDEEERRRERLRYQRKRAYFFA